MGYEPRARADEPQHAPLTAKDIQALGGVDMAIREKTKVVPIAPEPEFIQLSLVEPEEPAPPPEPKTKAGKTVP